MTLGNQIKIARRLSGLTQTELADIVGMTRQQIGRIESDKNSPLHCNVIKIKQALNIPL